MTEMTFPVSETLVAAVHSDYMPIIRSMMAASRFRREGRHEQEDDELDWAIIAIARIKPNPIVCVPTDLRYKP